MRLRLGVLVTCIFLPVASPAMSETQFGPFVVDPAYPGIILLNGEIDIRSPLEFRRALQAVPNAKLVLLDSPGGSVPSGLLIAEEVYDRKLDTLVPTNSTCASACSFVFLAGRSRKVNGRLGVHQMQGDVQDNAYTQLNLADVVEAITKYGTAPGVLALMLKTPSDQIHYFSEDEIQQFGLNRTAVEPRTRQHESQPSLGLPATPKKDPLSIDNLLRSLQGG